MRSTALTLVALLCLGFAVPWDAMAQAAARSPPVSARLARAAGPPASLDQAPRGVSAIPEVLASQPFFDPAQSAGPFVGVRRFPSDPTLSDAPYAVDDAVDLAHLLSLGLDPPLILPERVHVALSGEPQKPESRDRLKELEDAGAQSSEAMKQDIERALEKQAKAAGPGGLLVVSFATHGACSRGSDYLLTASSLDRALAPTSLAVQSLMRTVSRSAAPRRLVFLDACREPRKPRSPSTRGAMLRASSRPWRTRKARRSSPPARVSRSTMTPGANRACSPPPSSTACALRPRSTSAGS